MKKTPITFLTAALLLATVIRAQNLQDGINDYYAERYKGAKAKFEKMIAENPNNIDATYWLGQTMITSGDVNAAKELYSKALMASANAPLLIVGMGQVELIQDKPSEANQRFEAAITMTHSRKGDDPDILNAVGRAIANTYTDKNKKGDINYAVQKLEAAAERDPKNADIFLNLGNAYRKARPGEAGKAFENYTKATEINSHFARPFYQLANIFNTQHNPDLYEKYLNDAINADPSFAPAYYDLYYLKLGKLDFNAAQDMASKYIANSDPDPQADHFKAQTYWAEKKYDEAISISKNIIAKAGEKTQPRTYILLADAYLGKGDTAAGKPYIDKYFATENPEKITAVHYRIRADIYSAVPGGEDVVLNSYIEGAKADTVLDNKIDLLKKGADFFKSKKQYAKESQLRHMILEIKPDPSLTDLFNASLADYFAQQYGPGREVALQMIAKYPDQVYGYEWAFNHSRAVDTTRKDSIAVPDGMNLLGFVNGDTVKYGNQIKNASYLIAIYYNEKNELDSAIKYLKLMKSATTDMATRESIQNNIKALEEASSQQKKSKSATGSGGNVSPASKPEG